TSSPTTWSSTTRTAAASRCSRTPARTSRRTTARPSTRRCSTTSRWASTTPRPSSTTRAATACAYCRWTSRARTGHARSSGEKSPSAESPLREMSADERLTADYAGTGVTLGPHPMALRRAALAARGVTRAIDLARGDDGARVRIAGSVIVRQRPGTAKGFVFLSLEDETGIANVIVTPGLFAHRRLPLVSEPFLLVEGILQMQDGVVSVRAGRVEPLPRLAHVVPSHDFGYNIAGF